jgi:hypothetical protein
MKLNERYLLFLKRFINLLVISMSMNHAAYASASDSEEGDQSIQYGIGQQRQLFSFEDQDLQTTVVSQALQYQYSLSDKLIGFALSRTSADKSRSGDRAYQLEFDSQAVFVFAEINIEDLWLGMGASQGNDDSQYEIQYNNVQGDVSNNTDFRNLTIDIGYGRFLSSSYWSVGAGLTHQWLVAKRQLILVRTVNPIVAQNSNTTEQALLASVNANYEHYFSISEYAELLLSGAVNHQFTLSGDGRIQLNQQRRGPSGVQQNQLSKELGQPNSTITSLSVRLSLLRDVYTLSAEVDQLSDQSAADAYYGLSLGMSF